MFVGINIVYTHVTRRSMHNHTARYHFRLQNSGTDEVTAVHEVNLGSAT